MRAEGILARWQIELRRDPLTAQIAHLIDPYLSGPHAGALAETIDAACGGWLRATATQGDD